MIKIVKTRYIVDRNVVHDNNEPSGYVSSTYAYGYCAIKNNQYVLQPMPGCFFESIGEFVSNYRDGVCSVHYSHTLDEKYSEVVEEYETDKELYMNYPEYLI